jgi:hypothetical protein
MFIYGNKRLEICRFTTGTCGVKYKK